MKDRSREDHDTYTLLGKLLNTNTEPLGKTYSTCFILNLASYVCISNAKHSSALNIFYVDGVFSSSQNL